MVWRGKVEGGGAGGRAGGHARGVDGRVDVHASRLQSQQAARYVCCVHSPVRLPLEKEEQAEGVRVHAGSMRMHLCFFCLVLSRLRASLHASLFHTSLLIILVCCVRVSVRAHSLGVQMDERAATCAVASA
jgi:hypothetical protein